MVTKTRVMPKILVVDDEPDAVELIDFNLKAAGYDVVTAADGNEALKKARSSLPDLIVLDLIMPEVNGFDVVAALNEHSDTARIPVLVVTAKRITDEDRARLDGYVAAIMEKTEFQRDLFTAEVRRATARRPLVA